MYYGKRVSRTEPAWNYGYNFSGEGWKMQNYAAHMNQGGTGGSVKEEASFEEETALAEEAGSEVNEDNLIQQSGVNERLRADSARSFTFEGIVFPLLAVLLLIVLFNGF